MGGFNLQATEGFRQAGHEKKKPALFIALRCGCSAKIIKFTVAAKHMRHFYTLEAKKRQDNKINKFSIQYECTRIIFFRLPRGV